MCGICGFIGRREVDEQILTSMNDTMTHRGPDDRGVELFSMAGEYVGIAHRRLSILDLSPLGHQPMWSGGRDTAIVFNGEIYNFLELKKELINYGYVFYTSCDTEVILSAFAQWGTDCVKHFNGMFAFVIVDRKNKVCFAARDRFGKKPFYYFYTPNEFVFASELKPIMKYPYFQKHINTTVLGRFLHHGYIQAPDSIFENTFQLPAGHCMTIQNNKITLTCYWSPVTAQQQSNSMINDFDEAKRLLSAQIDAAVQRRMIADVPLGTFLSGGIDSTLVTAFAQQNSSVPVKTYSIGFADKEYNEAGFSKKIAKHLGTDHHETYITEDMMLDLVNDISQYYDEPFGDSSQIPTMLVSQIAREDITVALSGDGGDELFCGYVAYDKVFIAQILDTIGSLVYPLTQIAYINKRIPFAVRTIAANRDVAMKTQIPSHLSRGSIARILRHPYKDIYYPIEDGFPLKNWQLRRMLLDMQTYLPGDILHKVDRASMRYSLETRCPLLDYEIAELTFRLPHQFKYKKGDKKHILKALAYEFVPKDLLDRPKKGFAVPVEKWLKGALRDKLEAFTEKTYIEEQKLFNYNGICAMKASLFEKNADGYFSGRLVWHFLMFQMWYDTYMK